jgi:hypothetical protein
MPGVSLDRFKPGSDDLDNLVVTTNHHVRQSRSDSFLVVRNQNPHTLFAELFMPVAAFLSVKFKVHRSRGLGLDEKIGSGGLAVEGFAARNGILAQAP